jgi:excisionase family DNA binding protein
MDAESRDLLTVEQAANYLQLSQSSIRSYIRQGKLKAFRVAGKRKVLIPRDELLKLLEPARGDILDEIEAQGEEDEGGPSANGRGPRGGAVGK